MIDPSFQRVNRLFVLSLENDNDRTLHTEYYLPTVEIKDYNVMIDGKNYFDQPVKSTVRTLLNNYMTGCLLDYSYLNNYYKIIAIDLSKK